MYRESLAGAALGVLAAFLISCLLMAVVPEPPGENGGRSMAIAFCGFPFFAVIGVTIGVHRVRRRFRRYFEDRPGQLPVQPRQRPYQRRDGSF